MNCSLCGGEINNGVCSICDNLKAGIKLICTSCSREIEKGTGQIYDGKIHCDNCGNLKAIETVDKLKNFGSGAHAHTANKCAFYIEETINASVEQKRRLYRFNPYCFAHGILQDKLIDLANNFMMTNNWKELQDYMGRWW
jgi:hypothetical protein